MTNPAFLGYLTNPYLQDPYSGDTGLYSWGMEVNRQIVNAVKPMGSEVQREINDRLYPIAFEVARQIADHPKPVAMEIFRQIANEPHQVGSEVARQILNLANPMGSEATLVIMDSDTFGMEIDRITSVDFPVASEVDRQVVTEDSRGSEAERIIKSDKLFGSEVSRFIVNRPHSVGMEVSRQILDQTSSYAMEIRRDHSMASWLCDEMAYLEQPYLSGPYLTAGICSQMGAEVNRQLFKDLIQGMEVNRVIKSDLYLGAEARLIVANHPNPIAMEIEMMKALTYGMQTRLVLYNTTNLRILVDFPSRGASGVNWTSTSTATGDFSPNNLNTDIVEQQWRSQPGVSSVVLTCDTEVVQGTPIDTLAMLNHNLTTSAVITAEGSNSPVFAPVQETFAIVPTRGNAYYIAPTFPTLQSRYWRFIINDPTNPDAQLKIGTIVFGTTVIFQGECFTDNVTRRLRHFADKIATEGFTNVSNDRALKTAVALDFRFLRYDKGNYKNIRSIFETARTSLKCLWVPTPQDPGRFGVFGKLVTIPDEVHINLGHTESNTVDFSLEVDESL